MMKGGIISSMGMTTKKQIMEQQRVLRNNSAMINNNIVEISSTASFPAMISVKDEQDDHPDHDQDQEISTRSAFALFRAKEDEIERKKTEMRDMVEAHLGRAEEATKRLAEIREELEALTDPMRKEVSFIRKKIDLVNKELKPLGLTCQKKEKEYKEVQELFNVKNKEKSELIAKLMELVNESERLRMKKLEELSKDIDILH